MTTMYMPSNHASVWKLRGWPLGWLLSPAGFARPVRGDRLVPFACDNGMYHAPGAEPKGMKALVPFYAMLKRVRDEGWTPAWVTAPDVPYKGAESLALSLKHEATMRYEWPDCPVALAVQDGMAWDVLDAAPWRCCFIAGSDRWKDATLRRWTAEAHARGMLAHVARVNCYRRAVAVREAGADSADGTSWGRGRRKQIEDLLRGLYPERTDAEIRETARIVAPRELKEHLWSSAQ